MLIDMNFQPIFILKLFRSACFNFDYIYLYKFVQKIFLQLFIFNVNPNQWVGKYRGE